MITEPSRQVPVFRTCDVLVVGGGPAGTAAAATAARMGADTIVLERYGHLGGMSTGGFVVYIERMTDWEGRQVIAGIANEILDRLPREHVLGPSDELWGSRDPKLVEYWGDRSNAHHGIITWSPTVDPEMLKIVSSDLLRERGVKQLLHSWAVAPIMDGTDVKGVIFESKSGRQAILAEVVIDATGDGDIFAMAGAPFEGDIESDDIHHKINVAFMWGGVDMERFFNFRREHSEEFQQIMKDGFDGGLASDAVPHAMPRNDVALFMGPRLSGYSAIDVEDLTQVEIESRDRMQEVLAFYKQNMPGFDDAWILSTAPQMGTRHSRRLLGVKKVLREEWTQGVVHEDEIGISPPPNPRSPNVSMPLGSMLPVGVDGLMAAGRNLACDAATHTFLRLVPQCWVMGQAAAVAATTAINAGVAVRDVDVAEVRSQLARQGVVLHRQADMPDGLTM
jgi:hypothetical protein